MSVSLKTPQVFYGWWVVAAAFLIGSYAAGVVAYGFTTVFEPIANETGWSYTQISLAASLRGLEASFLAPIAGALADRWGPRKLIFGAIVIIIGGLILASHATSLSMFYGAFVLMAAGMNGCSMTVPMTAVANWFRRKVGIASGIAGCGPGFGGLVVLAMVRLIEIFGWRRTLDILALCMLLAILPLSLVFRHKPEQYGYVPDGKAESRVFPENSASLTEAAKADVSTRQALKSSLFWRITLAFLCTAIVTFTVITHVMPYLSSIGVPRSLAGMVATAVPLTSIVGRLGFGWLGDKVDRRLLAAGASGLIGIGLLCFGFTSVERTWILVPFLVLLGIGYGGYVPLMPSLVRQYFGRARFGTIFGFATGITMLGSILGPPIAGWVYDSQGSYQSTWFVLAGLSIVAITCVFSISRVKSH
jgi:MFS family permease